MSRRSCTSLMHSCAGALLAASLALPALAGSSGGGGHDPVSPFLDPDPRPCDPGGPVNWRPLLDSMDQDLDQIGFIHRHIIAPARNYTWSKIPASAEMSLIKDIIFGCD